MARVLFDQGTPVGLRKHLRAHRIDTVAAKGWGAKENGELLELAENADYDVLVTTDSNIRHQQNLSRRKIAIVVLVNARWPNVASHATAIATAIDETGPAQVTEVRCAVPQTTPPAVRKPPRTTAPARVAAEAAAKRLPTPSERRRAANRQTGPAPERDD